MEITIKFNTENDHDMSIVNRISDILSAEGNCEAAKSESEEKSEDVKKPRAKRKPKAEAPAEAAPVEDPAITTPIDIPEETAEEPVEQMPFDAEVEEPKPEPEKAGCTLQEWRVEMENKKKELGVDDAGENAAMRSLFNDFVHRLSETYGNRVPSKLTDEKRGEFLKEFKSIVWTKEEGFHTTYVPY